MPDGGHLGLHTGLQKRACHRHKLMSAIRLYLSVVNLLPGHALAQRATFKNAQEMQL